MDINSISIRSYEDFFNMQNKIKTLIANNECRIERLKIMSDIFDTLRQSEIKLTPEMYEKLKVVRENDVLMDLLNTMKLYSALPREQIHNLNDIIINNLIIEGIKYINIREVNFLINKLLLSNREKLIAFYLPIIERFVKMYSPKDAEETARGVCNEGNWSEELLETYCEWLDGGRAVHLHTAIKLIYVTAFLGKVGWTTADRLDFAKSIENDTLAVSNAAKIAKEFHEIPLETLTSLKFVDFLISNLNEHGCTLDHKIKVAQLLVAEEKSSQELSSVKEGFYAEYGNLIQRQYVIKPVNK